LALFPLAGKPDARHRSPTRQGLGSLSVEATARLMQSFMQQRSFTADDRIIDMRVYSC
jgi:hypothetical protein